MYMIEAMETCITMRKKGIRRNVKVDPDYEGPQRFTMGDFLRPVWSPGHDDPMDQHWVWNSDGVPLSFKIDENTDASVRELKKGLFANDWIMVD